VVSVEALSTVDVYRSVSRPDPPSEGGRLPLGGRVQLTEGIRSASAQPAKEQSERLLSH